MWRWRGLFADIDKGARIGGLVMLTIMCVAMVATQLSYVTFGSAHLMLVLAPVTALALLNGPIVGALIGAITGLAELIHATYLPLDIYERYFAAPWNSVVLFALVGFLMGTIFAFVDRYREQDGWRRKLGLALCCLIGSLFFSSFFVQSAYLINSLIAHEVPTEIVSMFTGSREYGVQVLGDFAIMYVLSLLADYANERRLESMGVTTLRTTFQGWLIVVIGTAYMVIAALSYTFVSIACRGTAEMTMQNQIEYLQGQLSERDSLTNGVVRRTHLTQIKAEELHDSTIGSVATGLALGEGSVAAVAEDDVIVSASHPEWMGKRFDDVVGSGLEGGFDETLYTNTRSTDWYMGNGHMGYLRAAQMGYMRVAKTGSYQMMVAMPASEVFAYRSVVMFVVSGAFLLILVAMYVQASVLLREVVVKGFNRTNEVLSRITGGSLNEVVDVESSIEFSRLSHGINTTVGSLRDSLEQTKAAIERELATARAIQESALPTTFPPFPDVNAFDIYASMDAAKEVGGDFYDFFLINDHTLGFLIADVSGKGIPAALFMMSAKTEIANLMQSGMSVDEALGLANIHLCVGNDASMFVTAWAATLDFTTGELTYVNAGHNPPLLRHAGVWQWMEGRGGPFMGATMRARYRSTTITLEPNDELLLYTDGVTEACDTNDVLYGEERLERLLADHANEHPYSLIESIQRSLRTWARDAEQSDDITMLVLEYGVAPEVRGEHVMPATPESYDELWHFVHSELDQHLCPPSVHESIDAGLKMLLDDLLEHRYRGRSTPGDLEALYMYHTKPATIAVALRCEGEAFEFFPPERGVTPKEARKEVFGALDDVTYLRDDNKNIVVFTKSW